jgi:integrase
MAIEHGCSCVQEIDGPKLQKWFYNKTRTVKVSTAVAHLFWIKHFLRWCKEERRVVVINAAEKVKIPRHPKSVRRNFLPFRDAQRLIDHCLDEELRFALYCAIHAGFRFGEVVMARPQSFNMESRIIDIQQDKDWQPKNGKNRTIPGTLLMKRKSAWLRPSKSERAIFLPPFEVHTKNRNAYSIDPRSA